jgi:general secretion pathway protein F
MQFELRALDDHQQVQTLILEALDEADARAQATSRRLTPLSLRAASAWRWRGQRGNSRNNFNLLLFAQELLALVAAGLSVIEALDALAERAEAGATRNVLSRLVNSLREGLRLSAALAGQGSIFPALFVGIVQAAEGTSDLPRALERYVDYESRIHAVRHRIVSAAIYPAILLVVGGAVALFLLGYVVPKFATVYEGSGRPLPWASQMLLSWGQFAAQYALWLAAGLATVLVLGFKALQRSLRNGGWWRLLGWLPGAGPRLQVFELSRLYLTLGMLLEGGIPIQQALRLSEAVLPRERIAALQQVSAQVAGGDKLSDALERNGLSSSVALRLLRVGEQSGQLGQMLTHTAQFYDSETSRWIERFTKTFEPILMAAIGIVIGLIVVLLYMPIFDLAGSLQ